MLGLGIEMLTVGTDGPASLLFSRDDSGMHLWCRATWEAAPADRVCGKRGGHCEMSMGLGGNVELWISSRSDCEAAKPGF